MQKERLNIGFRVVLRLGGSKSFEHSQYKCQWWSQCTVCSRFVLLFGGNALLYNKHTYQLLGFRREATRRGGKERN